MKFLIQCFNRSLSKPKPKWKEEVWSLMCAYAQETCVAVTMEQLVQGMAAILCGGIIYGIYSPVNVTVVFVVMLCSYD